MALETHTASYTPLYQRDETMTLSTRSKPYLIPEYSLTGDFLSYQMCGLQYRYYSRGSLPSSTPVQLWFGEFIHGVMEESFRRWEDVPANFGFPWDWKKQIRPIEENIDRRLRARGLNSPPRLYCPFHEETKNKGLCDDTDHPHKLLASKRAETAINTWGQHLFPLIDNAEVKLKGCRPMPDYQKGISRSNSFGINGVIDVISSVNLNNAPTGNLILRYLNSNPDIRSIIDDLTETEFEIIIDYKGMRRPPAKNPDMTENIVWKAHGWQVQTYSWLRSRQPESKRPVVGILFYLNELIPSIDDMSELRDEMRQKTTDVLPTKKTDIQYLEKGSDKLKSLSLSADLREERSIRLIPITDKAQEQSLKEFDSIVAEIEASIIKEIDCGSITKCWKSRYNEKTCTACDAKRHCPSAKKHYKITVP
jgi:hypothetical protein